MTSATSINGRCGDLGIRFYRETIVTERYGWRGDSAHGHANEIAWLR